MPKTALLIDNLPIAIPSKIAWMESAKTMTKLLIADKILFSLALTSTTGSLLFSGEVSYKINSY